MYQVLKNEHNCRVEKEAYSTTEERLEDGKDILAQAKQHPVDKTNSSPDDKAKEKKKRSSIFKFRNKSSVPEAK